MLLLNSFQKVILKTLCPAISEKCLLIKSYNNRFSIRFLGTMPDIYLDYLIDDVQFKINTKELDIVARKVIMECPELAHCTFTEKDIQLSSIELDVKTDSHYKFNYWISAKDAHIAVELLEDNNSLYCSDVRIYAH